MNLFSYYPRTPESGIFPTDFAGAAAFVKRWPALSVAESLRCAIFNECSFWCGEAQKYIRLVIYVRCSMAKEAKILFDEYSTEGFHGESIESMQPKKRRTRINY